MNCKKRRYQMTYWMTQSADVFINNCLRLTLVATLCLLVLCAAFCLGMGMYTTIMYEVDKRRNK